MIKIRNRKELRAVLITLMSALVFAVCLALVFAVLFFTGAGTKPASAVPADTEALAALRQEKEALESLLAAYRDKETEAETDPPETEDPSAYLPTDTAEITAPADTEKDAWGDIVGSFDPGNLSPADPDSLTYTFDLNKQLSLIEALEASMDNTPYIVDPQGDLMLREDVTFEEEDEILYREVEAGGYDSDGKPLVREIDWEGMGYSFPTVAVSYRDMERGTTYSYLGDEVYFSASLIKAPYIYALLHEFAQFYEIKRANPENDPEVGDTLSREIWEKYDYDRKISITEDMVAVGSGRIKDMDLEGDGEEFTIRELIEYAILYSDNTAFRILRDEYGYEYFNKVSASLGIKSVFRSFNKLTANEAVIYLGAIYDFAEEYPEEGGMLISLMKKANHPVLIPAALGWGDNIAHKYGWDADSYHDMALVYGDAPYAICVMTNFDIPKNDPDLDTYIQSLVKQIDAIHKSFYAFHEKHEAN